VCVRVCVCFRLATQALFGKCDLRVLDVPESWISSPSSSSAAAAAAAASSSSTGGTLSRTASAAVTGAVVRSLVRVSDALHTNSFMYDFHIAQLFEYLEVTCMINIRRSSTLDTYTHGRLPPVPGWRCWVPSCGSTVITASAGAIPFGQTTVREKLCVCEQDEVSFQHPAGGRGKSVCICMYLRKYPCVYTTYVCVCYVCVFVCMYVCVCGYVVICALIPLLIPTADHRSGGRCPRLHAAHCS